MSKPTKVPVPKEKIEQHLEEQLNFLRKSIREYDAGDQSEFRRMALAIRILVHDTRNSQSLLRQTGLEQALFVSMAEPISKKNLLAEFSLALTELSDKGGRLKPVLDDLGFNKRRWLPFEEWWQEPVLRDHHRHLFKRSDIVLAVADTDGGAHVDPAIPDAYHKLANEHSIGVLIIGPDGEKPLEHIEKVYIRHIAWEVVTSIETVWAKVIGNRPCPCGSTRKYRYCGAKGRC